MDILKYFPFVGIVPYFPNHRIATILIITVKIILLSLFGASLFWNIFILYNHPPSLRQLSETTAAFKGLLHIWMELENIFHAKNLHIICTELTRMTNSSTCTKGISRLVMYTKMTWIWILIALTVVGYLYNLQKFDSDNILTGYYLIAHKLRYLQYFILIHLRNFCVKNLWSIDDPNPHQSKVKDVFHLRSLTTSIDQLFASTLLILFIEHMTNFLTVAVYVSESRDLKILMMSVVELILTSSLILFIIDETIKCKFLSKLMLLKIISRDANQNEDVKKIMIAQRIERSYILLNVYPELHVISLKKLLMMVIYLNSIVFVFMISLISNKKETSVDPDLEDIERLLKEIDLMLKEYQ